jgi:hypothetical protein
MSQIRELATQIQELVRVQLESATTIIQSIYRGRLARKSYNMIKLKAQIIKLEGSLAAVKEEMSALTASVGEEVAQTTLEPILQPSIATRSWKMNHAGGDGGMWQGEEEEFMSRPYIWACARRGDREKGTHRIRQQQYDRMSEMVPGDRMYFLPKTTIGASGRQLKGCKLKDEMRVGTIASCIEMTYPEHPSESGWFRLAVEWSSTKISVPKGDPMRKHDRGSTIMDISDRV